MKKWTDYLRVLVLFATLSGCAQWHLASADDEVDRILGKRQDQVLGERYPVDLLVEDNLAVPPEAYGFAPEHKQGDGLARFRPLGKGSATGSRLPTTLSDPIKLDIAGVLHYALLHSREYQFELEDIYLATLALTLERHLWSPQWIQEVRTRLDGAGQRDDFDRLQTSEHFLSVSQRLPYGGEVVASVLTSIVNDLRQNMTDTSASSATLSVSLPLLRGSGKAAYESRIQAERELIYAVRSFERFRREFMVQVASDYITLIAQRQQVENAEANFRSLRQLAKRETAFFNEGQISLLEQQRAEEQALQGENNWLDEQESYKANLDSFKLLLGMAPATPLALKKQELDVSIFQMALETAMKMAHESRLDLLTAADRADDARRGIAAAKNALLPDLDLDAGITADTEPELGMADFDGEDLGYSVALVLSLPLDRKSERNDYRASLISLERSRRDLSLLHDSVTVEVRRAHRRIELERNALRIQELNVESSNRRVDNATLRLNLGEVSNREVVEAQESLLTARNRLAQAKSSLAISILEFARDAGVLRVDHRGHWRLPHRPAQKQEQAQ